VSGTEPAARTPDIRAARHLFPATSDRAYFNTAATGLASQRLADSYHAFIEEKFLLNAGRGMGYCYLSPAAQARFTPVNAGWRAGSVPLDSFFGPEMNLSDTASRFDNSISWLAAIGNAAALTIFDEFGPGTIYARNQELTAKLRAALTSVGWDPLDLPEQNQSTIVSVPLGNAGPARLLRALSGQGIICSARDGNLRLAVHFYNHEDDIERLVTTLASLR